MLLGADTWQTLTPSLIVRQTIDEVCLTMSSLCRHKFQSFPQRGKNKNPIFWKILIPFQISTYKNPTTIKSPNFQPNTQVALIIGAHFSTPGQKAVKFCYPSSVIWLLSFIEGKLLISLFQSRFGSNGYVFARSFFIAGYATATPSETSRWHKANSQ